MDIVQNQYFLNEDSLDQYHNGADFPGLVFVDCYFENVSVVAKVFGSCSFQNCIFESFEARKTRFANCQFQDCQITSSGMTREEFYDTNFTNCKFFKGNLRASDFSRCTLKMTSFSESNLDVLDLTDVKVWKSNELVKINDFSTFDNPFDQSNNESWPFNY